MTARYESVCTLAPASNEALLLTQAPRLHSPKCLSILYVKNGIEFSKEIQESSNFQFVVAFFTNKYFLKMIPKAKNLCGNGAAINHDRSLIFLQVYNDLSKFTEKKYLSKANSCAIIYTYWWNWSCHLKNEVVLYMPWHSKANMKSYGLLSPKNHSWFWKILKF